MKTETCPKEEQLHHFLVGLAPESPDLESHVENCVSCQQALERLATVPAGFHLPTPPTQSDATAKWSDPRDRIADRVRTQMELNACDEATLPRRLGDYELLRILGEGGMGVVYLARQVRLNRHVALKVIANGRFSKRSFVDRFLLEAESAAKLDHPGIVPIYEVGESAGQVYYAMGHATGGSLADKLQEKPFASREAARCVRAIADAIDHAHSNGVIHRDLKPANILLDESGNFKVADFGLAKQLDSAASLTITGEVLGTPSYMPPEQARVTESEISTAGDLYSLGAILFHLLTGRPPFVAVEPVDVLHQLIHDEPIRPRQLTPSVDVDLETITLKCLAKNPDQRYESARHLRDELDRYLENKPILARPVGVLTRTWRWCLRNQTVAGLVASVVFLLVLGSVVSATFGWQANERANELAALNEDLREAQDAATRAANDATQQAGVALTQADTAMRLLESMLFDLQAPFRSDFAAQAQRRELLESVLRELDNLASDKINANRIKRCRATALLGLADVASQTGNETGLVGTSGSIEQSLAALQLFEELCQTEPGNPVYVFDLAEANWQCSQSYADEKQWRAAGPFFEAALTYGARALELQPDNAKFSRSMARYEANAAETLDMLKQGQRSIELSQSAIKRCRDLIQSGDGGQAVLEAMANAYLYLGDWHKRRREVAKARESFLSFRDVVKELASRYPLDYDIQMDYSTAYERIGDCSLIAGNRKQACEEYELSLELALVLGRAAPDNDQVQWDVSFSYQKLADGYLAYGKLEKARDNAIRCAEMRRKLVASGPNIAIRCLKLNHALGTLAKASRRLGDVQAAVECYREMIDVYRSFDERNNSTRFQKQIENYQKQLAGLDIGAS